MRIFILLFLAGCSSVELQSTRSNLPLLQEKPENLQKRPGIRLTCNETCTAHEREKVAEAERIINRIRTESCFQEMFTSRNLSKRLIGTGGRTREEVAADLATREAGVTVRFYREKSSTIGFRRVGSTVINLNRHHHDQAKKNNPWFVASNGFHEVSHVMGYRHDKARTKTRKYSVPYRVNRAVERCEREMRE